MQKSFTLLIFLFSQLIIVAAPPAKWMMAGSGKYKYQFVEQDPLKTRFYTLDNGLKVILTVNKKEPRIRALIPVRAGSNTDPRNNTGLAHYLEHMLFKGTDKMGVMDFAREKPLLDSIDLLYEKYNKSRDPEQRKSIYQQIDRISGLASNYSIANEYAKLMKSMGGRNVNAHTWYDETVYEDDIPSNALDRYLAVQKERFRKPVFRIFHTELEAVYEEKNRSMDDDNRKVFYAGMESLFPTTNYGLQTTIGTIDHLKNPSLIEIRNYYNNYYVPNNMAVILVGDLDPDQTIKKIEAHFSDMKSKPVKEYLPKPEPALHGVISKEVWGPTPERVTLAFRTPGQIYNREAVLNTVCDEILSNAAAGLIDLNLNKKQKVLNAGSTIQPNKDYNVAVLTGLPKQGQSLDEVKGLLLEQIKRLQQGEFEESLIQAIAANYKLRAIQNLENNEWVADRLADAFIQTKGDNWADFVQRIDLMKTITKKEVMEYAKKYYGDQYVVIYKRKGEDKSIVKIDKPSITPVQTNSNQTSAFLQSIEKMEMPAIQPKWMDFKADFTTGKLKGLDFYYVQNLTHDLFRYTLRFEMGSWANKLLPLAAQYLQYVRLPDMSSEEISKAFFTLACNYNFNVGNEVTTIQLTGLQENFTPSVQLLEKLLNTSLEDEQAWSSLKQRLLKARQDAKSNRLAIRQGLQQYAAYGASNPFNHVLSDQELNQVTAKDLMQVIHQMTQIIHEVVYFGPSPLNEIKAQLSQLHRPDVYIPVIKGKGYKKLIQGKPIVLFAPYEMVQAEVNWILNTSDYDPGQSALVQVFNNYFGAGGFTSIVPQTLRESKALAYATNAQYLTPGQKDEKYTLNAYIGTQADKLAEAISGMNELLMELPQVDDFVANAKTTVLNNIETERVTGDDVVFRYFTSRDKGLWEDERAAVYKEAASIQYPDLKAFHQKFLSNKPYTLCVVGAPDKVDQAVLSRHGDVKKLSMVELFGY